MKEEIVKIIYNDLIKTSHQVKKLHFRSVFNLSALSFIILFLIFSLEKNIYLLFFVMLGLISLGLLMDTIKNECVVLEKKILNQAFDLEKELNFKILSFVSQTRGFAFEQVKETCVLVDFKDNIVLLQAKSGGYKEIPLKELIQNYKHFCPVNLE